MIKLALFIALICLVQSQEGTYDSDIAFTMVRASSAAYCDQDEVRTMQCGDACDDLSGFEFVSQSTYDIDDKESISFTMFINTDAQMFVTAFRGTHGLVQLISELLEGGATSYDLYDLGDAVATTYFYEKYTQHIRSDFMANFEAYYAQYPDFQMYITGHSLGGAFATLAALDISLAQILPKEQIHLYNYGSPRVGDSYLAQAVIDNVGEVFRVTHFKDAVPHVPPCFIGLDGHCKAWADHPSENGLYLFNAWHISPEIFYSTEDTQTPKVCTVPEDPSCSDSFAMIAVNVADHLLYLGKSIKCLAKGPIQNMFM